MMATTATSARPEIELRGTSAVSKLGSDSVGSRIGVANSAKRMSVIEYPQS
jgi:hypothetical protein